MPTSNPTYDQMLVLVGQRAPDLSDAKKSELATVALTILQDPNRTDIPIQAVKLAIARDQRPR